MNTQIISIVLSHGWTVCSLLLGLNVLAKYKISPWTDTIRKILLFAFFLTTSIAIIIPTHEDGIDCFHCCSRDISSQLIKRTDLCSCFRSSPTPEPDYIVCNQHNCSSEERDGSFRGLCVPDEITRRVKFLVSFCVILAAFGHIQGIWVYFNSKYLAVLSDVKRKLSDQHFCESCVKIIMWREYSLESCPAFSRRRKDGVRQIGNRLCAFCRHYGYYPEGITEMLRIPGYRLLRSYKNQNLLNICCCLFIYFFLSGNTFFEVLIPCRPIFRENVIGERLPSTRLKPCLDPHCIVCRNSGAYHCEAYIPLIYFLLLLLTMLFAFNVRRSYRIVYDLIQGLERE